MATDTATAGCRFALARTKLEDATFAVTAILAPRRCLGCGVSLTGVTILEPRPLCDRCTAKLPRTPQKQCRHCGQPLISEEGSCLRCRDPEEEWYLAGLKSLFLYRGTAIPLIHALKGRGSRLVAAFLADLVISAAAIPTETNLLVPVPSSRAGRRRRGFDQAELLAAAISRRSGLPWARQLLRTRGGEQKRLGREGRVHNIADQLRLRRRLPSIVPPRAIGPESALAGRTSAVGAAPQNAGPAAKSSGAATEASCSVRRSTGDARRAEGVRILLVDDVATTGATAEAAARVLVTAGAEAVSALVICRD